MSPVDIAVLLLIAAAFVAVVLRVRKKGTCGDCGSSGSCSSCGTSKKASCPACAGVESTAEKLGRNVGK